MLKTMSQWIVLASFLLPGKLKSFLPNGERLVTWLRFVVVVEKRTSNVLAEADYYVEMRGFALLTLGRCNVV